MNVGDNRDKTSSKKKKKKKKEKIRTIEKLFSTIAYIPDLRDDVIIQHL